jgi:hypothetical protein
MPAAQLRRRVFGIDKSDFGIGKTVNVKLQYVFAVRPDRTEQYQKKFRKAPAPNAMSIVL